MEEARMPSIGLRSVVQILVWFLLCPAVQAQQEHALPRIAILWPGDVAAWNSAFLEGLRDNGYVNGVTAVIDLRNTGGDFSPGYRYAQELLVKPRRHLCEAGRTRKGSNLCIETVE